MTPIRYSHLRAIGRSPAHYRHACEGQREQTPAMRMGTIVHGLVLAVDLGPVIYEGERRGKAWADFAAAHEGRDIVTSSEVARAVPIADAVGMDPVAGPLIHAPDAWRERTLAWTFDGLPCQGTPDSFDPTTGILLDLKTTSDASPRAFARHAWSYSYHAQLAWYAHALTLAGHTVRECLLVAVETSAPYGVTVHRLSPRLLEEGHRQWRAWWEQLRVCIAADQWPGYAESVCELDVPAWIVSEDDGEDA